MNVLEPIVRPFRINIRVFCWFRESEFKENVFNLLFTNKESQINFQIARPTSSHEGVNQVVSRWQRDERSSELIRNHDTSVNSMTSMLLILAEYSRKRLQAQAMFTNSRKIADFRRNSWSTNGIGTNAFGKIGNAELCSILRRWCQRFQGKYFGLSFVNKTTECLANLHRRSRCKMHKQSFCDSSLNKDVMKRDPRIYETFLISFLFFFAASDDQFAQTLTLLTYPYSRRWTTNYRASTLLTYWISSETRRKILLEFILSMMWKQIAKSAEMFTSIPFSFARFINHHRWEVF